MILRHHRAELLSGTYVDTRFMQAVEEIDFLTRPEVIANPHIEGVAVDEFGFHVIARRPTIFERITWPR